MTWPPDFSSLNDRLDEMEAHRDADPINILHHTIASATQIPEAMLFGTQVHQAHEQEIEEWYTLRKAWARDLGDYYRDMRRRARAVERRQLRRVVNHIISMAVPGMRPVIVPESLESVLVLPGDVMETA